MDNDIRLEMSIKHNQKEIVVRHIIHEEDFSYYTLGPGFLIHELFIQMKNQLYKRIQEELYPQLVKNNDTK